MADPDAPLTAAPATGRDPVEPAPAQAEPVSPMSPAALVGYGAFLVLGWSSVLIPSLVTPIEQTFGVSDADIGALYFGSAVAFLAGTVAAGVLGERVRSSLLLRASLALLVVGLAAQAVAPSWIWLFVAVVVRSCAVGGLEVGVNALFLALFPVGRGRALNLVHVWFAAGALLGPLLIGQLLARGVSWQVTTLATAAVTIPVVALAMRSSFPSHVRTGEADEGSTSASADDRWSLLPFAGLALAMACYVAAEVGVSSWVVRYLSDAPVVAATGALALFWGGLTVGRLLASLVADRFPATAFAVVSMLAGSALLAVAVVVPLEPALVLYTLAGACYGPVYPMIMVLGSELYPRRLSALSGGLTAAAFAGSLIYPPLVGVLAEPVGIAAGLLGAAALGIPTAAGVLLARAAATRTSPRRHA